MTGKNGKVVFHLTANLAICYRDEKTVGRKNIKRKEKLYFARVKWVYRVVPYYANVSFLFNAGSKKISKRPINIILSS